MAGTPKIRLRPGETSIDRVVPTRTKTGWSLHWRIMLHDGTAFYKRTEGRTRQDVRRKAHLKADELLAASSDSTWTRRSHIETYMKTVTLPAIHTPALAQSTQRRYMLAYRLLLGDCVGGASCKHKKALKGLTIDQAMRPRRLKECLEEIGRLHGVKNVKHCRIVARSYIAAPLIIDGVLKHNPLTDLRLDLSTARQPPVKRGGHSLTLDQYHKAIDYLFSLDPTDVPEARQGRWSTEIRQRERRALIEFVLTQASTAMRTGELASRRVEDAYVDKDGGITFWIPPEATKTRKGRRAPVINPRVSELIVKRKKALPEGSYLFGAPSDPMKAWQPRSRDRKLAKLYEDMATACDIPMFTVERGHSWRTILNSLWLHDLSQQERSAVMGHHEEVNEAFYTDVQDVTTIRRRAIAALEKNGGINGGI